MTKIAYIVTGMGRSGTMWLARLLDCDPRIHCGHERLARFDSRRYAVLRDDSHKTELYLQRRLKNMAAIRKKDHPDQPWGEVNSYLRYMASEMRAVFECPVVGLIRDGKYTVRSLLARGTYKRKKYPQITPPESLREADAFSKTCWYWADAYRRLLAQGVTVYSLEGLNDDYRYFQKMCRELDTSIGRHDWRRYRRTPIHWKFKPGTPLDWTEEQHEIFEEIAGDVQEEFYAGTT